MCFFKGYEVEIRSLNNVTKSRTASFIEDGEVRVLARLHYFQVHFEVGL
jgi:hypothetical protein